MFTYVLLPSLSLVSIRRYVLQLILCSERRIIYREDVFLFNPVWQVNYILSAPSVLYLYGQITRLIRVVIISQAGSCFILITTVGEGTTSATIEIKYKQSGQGGCDSNAPAHKHIKIMFLCLRCCSKRLYGLEENGSPA